jgi:CBS domain-containing protein
VDRLWFSALPGRPLRSEGAPYGRIADGVIRLVEVGDPPLTGLVVEHDGEALFVPIRRVRTLDHTGAELEGPPDGLGAFERRPGEILLGRDLIGHKLICLRSRLRPRLVRADDVVLERDDSGLHVGGIEVADGLGHPIRRLVDRFHRRRADDVDDGTPRAVVAWADLEPFVGHVPTARRRLGLRRLRRMHPAQIADLLEEASSEEGREILGALEQDRALEADVIEELDLPHRLEAVRDRSDAEVAALLGAMAPDDAADLLASLDQDRRGAVLELMPGPEQDRVRALLGYHPETAGGLMTPTVLALAGTTTVGEARAALASAELPDNVGVLFTVDEEGRLSGSVALAKLFAAPATASLDSLAQPDPPRVAPSADLVEVAVTMADFNLTALAVVDDDDRVLGVVTVDDVLARVLPAGWRRRMEALNEGI